MYMQDGAACHRANETKVWFEHHNVELLERPSCLHDLSPAESLYGIILRHAYGHGKHYESKEPFMNRILGQSATIEQRTLVNLARSLPNRIAAALQVRGKQTKYSIGHGDPYKCRLTAAFCAPPTTKSQLNFLKRV